MRSHDSQDAPIVCDVEDLDVVSSATSLQPGPIASLRCSAGDHKKIILVKSSDGEICLNAPSVVQPLGVHPFTRRHINRIRAQLFKNGQRVGAADRELSEGTLIEKADRGSHRFTFGSHVLVPVLFAVGVVVVAELTLAREPIWAFPAGCFAEHRSRCI